MANVKLGNHYRDQAYHLLVSAKACPERTILLRALESAGYVIHLFETDQKLEQLISSTPTCAVALLDLNLEAATGYEMMSSLKSLSPDTQIVSMADKESSFEAIEAERRGAFWQLVEPISIETLLFVVARASIVFELAATNRLLLNSVSSSALPEHVKNLSLHSTENEKILRLSNVNSTLLITGETGTGKSTLARYIHQSGARRSKPFVSVSCATIPRDLLEAELFGYERGAFTGANNVRCGSFELANGGTLFLDEIAELPLDLQPKLLTFLQEREIRRLGSNRSIALDVRVIAATNAKLETLILERRFRQDLFYRLNVASYEVPALRARLDSIEKLAKDFLKNLSTRLNQSRFILTPGAIAALKSYHWPGNIRELENVLERAAIFSNSPYISEADLQLSNSQIQIKETQQRPLSELSLANINLIDLEREAIVQTLAASQNDKRLAAKMLGISVKTVYNKMQRLNIV